MAVIDSEAIVARRLKEHCLPAEVALAVLVRGLVDQHLERNGEAMDGVHPRLDGHTVYGDAYCAVTSFLRAAYEANDKISDAAEADEADERKVNGRAGIEARRAGILADTQYALTEMLGDCYERAYRGMASAEKKLRKKRGVLAMGQMRIAG